ncbi:MAG: ABC transporter permease [Lysobacteraceae bacterium]
MLTNLWFDIRYAVRLLRKTAAHSLLSASVVALSVGLALFIFVMNYAIAFRPLPFKDSGNWLSVQVAAKSTETSGSRIDAFTYQQLVSRRRDVNYIGAFSSREAVLSEGEESNPLRGSAISSDLLAAMNVAPQLGRLFTKEDGQSGSAPTVILSHDTWKEYFSSDAAIIGKQVRIDAQPMQVVGVMPKGFYAFQDYQIWFPLSLQPIASPSDSTLQMSAFVRFEGDQATDAILKEMQPVVDDVNRQFPGTFDSTRQIRLVPAFRIYSHANMPIIIVSSLIALAVLLLGAVNISMIFYARMLERSRELALRTALGSSRGRLLRQCLLESVVVVMLGLIVGIGLAIIGVEWGQSIRDFPSQILASGFPEDYPELRAIDLSVAVLAAVLIWLLSTLIPARRIVKQDAAKVISSSGKGMSSGGGNSKIAMILVGLQVIISSMLLVICVSMVAAVSDEASKPKGVSTAGIFVSTNPTVFDQRFTEPTSRINYWNELAAAIERRIPGAVATYSSALPTRPEEEPVVIENREVSASDGTLTLPVVAVADNYFETTGIKLISGRLFDTTDTDASLGVIVIDERTAKRYWPDQDLLGKRVRLDPTGGGPWLTIVGVVSHVAGEPYSGDKGAIYRSIRQAASDSFHLLVKSPIAGTNQAVAIRESAFTVDRDLPIHNIQKFDDVLAALDIGYASMIEVFSVIVGITVLLAATGLFGLISRSVVQRTQEIGIRRALGSSVSRVKAIFMRQALIYICIALVGGALGVVATNFLATLIPNALASIAAVIVGVIIVTFLVIFLATYFPTRRALALEPSEALRYE